MNGTPRPPATTWPGAVAWSLATSFRLTVILLRAAAWFVLLAFRSVRAWGRLFAGRAGEDKVMVLRRRKWILATFLALPLAAATLIAPGPTMRTIGLVPMAASLLAVTGAALMARRLTRRALTNRPAAQDTPAGPGIWGDYQPTTRSIELEQALGHTLWHFAANGLPVDTALTAARAMPHRSQLWLLTVAEANLAALGRLETNSTDGLSFGNTEAAVWLFPFCQTLRAQTHLPSNLPIEHTPTAQQPTTQQEPTR